MSDEVWDEYIEEEDEPRGFCQIWPEGLGDLAEAIYQVLFRSENEVAAAVSLAKMIQDGRLQRSNS